jgi:DNA-binding CsgD family transcriptional regulator
VGDETPEQALSALIGLIYDAALSPGLWHDALQRTCSFTHCAVGALYSHDIATREPLFHMLWGLDAHYTKQYLEEYAPTNMLIPAHLAADPGDILVASRLPLWQEFTESAFYTDWGKPQGLVDTLSTIVETTPTRLSMVSLIRHEREGLVDDDSLRRMALLRPHFLRAIRIGRALELRSVAASTLADSLDGLAAAVFVIDRDGRLAHSNKSGSALLQERSVFRLVAGRIRAVVGAVNAALAAALAQMHEGEPPFDRAPAIAIETDAGERYFAHVLPLTAGLRGQAGVAYAAHAAIFVVKAAINISAATELIGRQYKLTAAELRVLLSVVEIGGVAEIAAALGISEDTVRTHLRHVFDKTEVRSQIELVKLVAAHVAPLRT